MNSYIIQTTNLSYSYKKKQVLQNLSLAVPENSIYGFLGPNGAGKTTTIKLLLGLLSTSNHEITLFDKALHSHKIEILQQIGSMVEAPSIYKHLSAKDNLRSANAIYKKNKTRISEVLEITGLTTVADKKTKTFSQGMLQRLGIAMALLPDPKLLILDEPTNGLDPNGIIDIRNLLILLYKNYGKTIFLSSHLLSEMEKLTTDIGIIDKGKMLFQGSMDELNNISQNGVLLKTSQPESVYQLLISLGFNAKLTNDNQILINNNSEEKIAQAVNSIVSANIDIYSIIPTHKSLENLFLNITTKIN